MKSLKLIGLGNSEQDKRSSFILKKENLFKESFNEILEKLEIDYLIPIEESPISELENKLDHFKNDDFDIDVVYTKDRIFIIVRAEQKNLERFKTLLLAYAKLVE